MAKRGKRYTEAKTKISNQPASGFEEAVKRALESSFAKFDETVDVAVRLGVDPRHADQMVRGSVVLPNGTGKEVKILVFAKGEKEKEALDAGADFVGNDDLVDKIKEGWFGFDKAIATPDMMSAVGKLGRILGPRGMMPNAKLGTVTFDVGRVVKEIKSGKVDFKVDKAGVVHAMLGKSSFGSQKVKENVLAFIDRIIQLKPSTSKGIYLRSVSLSTTMGPGIKLDTLELRNLTKHV